MTCHELRLYFEDPLRMDADFPCEAEHLAHCTECARFVEVRHELGAGLRLVRESAPEPSAALETAVLANYRRRIAADPPLVRSRRRRFTVVCWIAAAAAVLAVAVVLLHPARRLETSNLKMESGRSRQWRSRVPPRKARSRVPWTNTASSPKTRLRSPRQLPPSSSTRDHEESSFRRFSQLDVL